MHGVITALLWFGAIGCGLMAGIYFAFSTFIVRALARTGPEIGSSAMNAINSDILRSLFLPLFFGTTIASLVLAVIGLADLGEAGAFAMTAGGLCYFAGMFVVTVLFNVPLNDRLAAAREDVEQVWTDYVRRWTLWNHLRTISCIASAILFTVALLAGAR